MISRTVGIAAGVATGIFIGYCIYFDRKRRNDPEFKEKLREKRRKQREELASKKSGKKVIDFKDEKALQTFFLEELQIGEELVTQGDMTGAVEHIANALAVCAQPQQLLQMLQMTLPPQVFQLLIQKLQSGAVPTGSKMAASGEPATKKISVLEDDDLE